MKRILLCVILFVLMFCTVCATTKAGTIDIALSTDNNYALPTVVTMTSILENKREDTHHDFYILLSGDFREANKEKILQLKNKYDNFDITFIDMKDEFKEAYTWHYITTSAYYRLMLPELLTHLDKILYLDVDLVVKKDLNGLYNTNIEGYYVAGVRDRGVEDEYARIIGLTDAGYYVNSGVLLLNLKLMRELNFEEAARKFITKYKSKDRYIGVFHDQDVINYVCYGKILKLPFKFNVMTHNGILEPKRWYTGENAQKCHTRMEWREGCLNPVIIHFSSCKKPWKAHNRPQFSGLWWQYAEKSPCWEEIKNTYSYK